MERGKDVEVVPCTVRRTEVHPAIGVRLHELLVLVLERHSHAIGEAGTGRVASLLAGLPDGVLLERGNNGGVATETTGSGGEETKHGLECHTTADVDGTLATTDLELRCLGDRSRTAGELSRVADGEVTVVLADKGDHIAILDAALLSGRGHDLDLVVLAKIASCEGTSVQRDHKVVVVHVHEGNSVAVLDRLHLGGGLLGGKLLGLHRAGVIRGAHNGEHADHGDEHGGHGGEHGVLRLGSHLSLVSALESAVTSSHPPNADLLNGPGVPM